MNISKVSNNKKAYIDLLLLADEQESMIDEYLERGEMFVLNDNGVKAECVVTKESDGIYELKNIAVIPECHRIQNFFTDHYDHLMFEDGKQLVDMVYLKREG